MPDLSTYRDRFDAHKICVLIPTYNNASSLLTVVNEVLAYTSNVIVVNDGSTDGTEDLLNEIKDIQSVHLKKNCGKGIALRRGFAAALDWGYTAVITMDADGQHKASDLPVFLDQWEKTPEAIIIGARNMSQTNVPGKSSFGHTFSNFWFKVETGIEAKDTQSGYRLYPVQRLKDFRFFTRKYEFEIEVLVRSAWRGIAIVFVPIHVYYPPAEERVTHFRPFQDFSRISVLNTFLVVIAFLYIKPRDFFRNLFRPGKFREFLYEHITGPNHSDGMKAASIGFGIFMGIVPIWGFQLVVAIFLAVLFRMNKALVVVAANISIPPMIPLILYLSFKTGGWMLGEHATQLAFTTDLSLGMVKAHMQQYLYGSIVFAFIAAVGTGLLSFLLIKIFNRKTDLAA